MKNIKYIMIGLSLICLLSACGELYKVNYRYDAPTSERGLRCVKHCEHSRAICQHRCSSQSDGCHRQAKEAAQFKYDEYVARQHAMNKPVNQGFDYFYDPMQCSDVGTCHCKEEYQACFELCGGILVPERRCVGQCD